MPPPPLPTLAFGKELWAKYLGDVGEEPPLPLDIEKILKSPCPFNHGKRVKETHLLTLIPKTVNGKPLTLNSLNELIQHPKQRKAIKYADYSYYDFIKKQYGSQPLQRSYWVLMTRDMIVESLGESYRTQVQRLKEQCQKAQIVYEVPQLLEATTSILMEYLRTGKRLFSGFCYIWCQERVSYEKCLPMEVGDFSEEGLPLEVGNFSEEYLVVTSFYPRDGNLTTYGLAGLRKF